MSTMIRIGLVLLLPLVVAGCVSTPATTYQPGVDNTERLLAGRGVAGVGRFDAAAAVENRSLNMRGSALKGGRDGTFSTYLQDAVVRELQEAGRYRQDASAVIGGTLLDNRLDAASGSGTARVSAEFVVIRDGQRVYARTLAVENRWESSFIGAIAIPAAIQGYSATVQKLLGELFADPEFRSAIGDGARPD